MNLTVDDQVRSTLKKIRVNNVPGLFLKVNGEEAATVVTSSCRKGLEIIDAPDILTVSEKFYFRNRLANFSAYPRAMSCRYMPHWNTLLYTPMLNRRDPSTQSLKNRNWWKDGSSSITAGSSPGLRSTTVR